MAMVGEVEAGNRDLNEIDSLPRVLSRKKTVRQLIETAAPQAHGYLPGKPVDYCVTDIQGVISTHRTSSAAALFQ